MNRETGKFLPGDIERICDALDYDMPTKKKAIIDAVERLEREGSESVNQILRLLDDFEFVSLNLKQEMGTKSGSLLKASVLEWSANPFGNMIVYKKELMTKIGHSLGLSPNFAFIDKNLETYSLKTSISKPMYRS